MFLANKCAHLIFPVSFSTTNAFHFFPDMKTSTNVCDCAKQRKDEVDLFCASSSSSGERGSVRKWREREGMHLAKTSTGIVSHPFTRLSVIVLDKLNIWSVSGCIEVIIGRHTRRSWIYSTDTHWGGHHHATSTARNKLWHCSSSPARIESRWARLHSKHCTSSGRTSHESSTHRRSVSCRKRMLLNRGTVKLIRIINIVFEELLLVCSFQNL